MFSLPYFIRSERGCYETKYYLWKYFTRIKYISLSNCEQLVCNKNTLFEVSTYDEAVKKLEKKRLICKETEAREYNKKVQNTTQTFSDPFHEKSDEEKVHM